MGFQVTLDKIYKRLDHTPERGFPRATYPSIEIIDLDNPGSTTEKVIHYISNKPTKPLNTSEMTQAELLDANSVHGLQTVVTWSCFVKQTPSVNIEIYAEGKIIDDNANNES